MRELIRRDQQQRAAKLKPMQEAISEGLASGDPKTFDVQAFKRGMMESLAETPTVSAGS